MPDISATSAARLTFAIGAVVSSLAWAAPAHADGPAFDCRKASLPDEKAICADPQLSAIDVLVNKAYKDFEPAFGGDKKAIARALAADRAACKADAACIVSVQNNALQTFGYAPAWVESYNEALIGKKALDQAARSPGANQPKPESVGQCAVTHIKSLITRFGESFKDAPPEAGSGIILENGSGGVSYDREAGLEGANEGDAAVSCLMSIPRDCPKGDERGRVYYGIDLVTNGTWILPDSQHLCGGA